MGPRARGAPVLYIAGSHPQHALEVRKLATRGRLCSLGRGDDGGRDDRLALLEGEALHTAQVALRQHAADRAGGLRCDAPDQVGAAACCITLRQRCRRRSQKLLRYEAEAADGVVGPRQRRRRQQFAVWAELGVSPLA